MPVDDSTEEFGIGGETLEHEKPGAKSEDGHVRIWVGALEVLQHLIADEGLVGESGVQSVDDEDVDRSVIGDGSEIGEESRRHGWRGDDCGGWVGAVLFEGFDGLRLA